MSSIWLPIIVGVVLIPFFSSYVRELEDQEKLEKIDVNFFFKKITTVEGLKSAEKFMNGAIVVVFIGIAVAMLMVISGGSGK